MCTKLLIFFAVFSFIQNASAISKKKLPDFPDNELFSKASIWNALDHGVKADAIVKRNKFRGDHIEPISGTDNSDAINNLILKVKDSGGGIVLLPAGDYLVAKSIVLQYGVSLIGVGRAATRIILADNANTHVITTYGSSDGIEKNSQMNMVAHLTIEGNKWNQKLPYLRHDIDNERKHAHGIFVVQNGISKEDEHGDLFHIFRDLYINNVYGTGLFLRKSRGENRVYNVYARRCGIGFVIGPDSKVTDCTADECEFYGFNIVHGSSSFVGCKAFRTGACVNNGIERAIADMRRAQPGFRIYGSGGRTTLSSCVAQNNGGEGFLVDTYGLIAVGIQADSNNMLATDPPKWIAMEFDQYDNRNLDPNKKVKKTDYAGIKLTKNAQNCFIEFMSFSSQGQGGSPWGFQYHALEIENGASKNSLRGVHTTELVLQERLGPPIKEGYNNEGKNTIEINGFSLEKNTMGF